MTRRGSAIQPSLVVLLIWIMVSASARALTVESDSEHLLQLGVKMFPTLVGGNLDLDNLINADGALTLLVLYQENRLAAQGVVNRLQASVRIIHKYPVDIRMVDVAGLSAWQTPPVAGVFLAESMVRTFLATIQQFGNHKKTIIFSPFDGDVQQGILSGLSISTQVKPALNLVTLRAAGIRMNPLFFKVAKTYE
ncbi:MAG: hypothetical protein G8237_11340 [Magnetococcales bacterium]|nr:hypothetical protein [Magnetococcales bacterium]